MLLVRRNTVQPRILPWWRQDTETLFALHFFCEGKPLDILCHLAWTKCWISRRVAVDLRRNDAHKMYPYDFTVIHTVRDFVVLGSFIWCMDAVPFYPYLSGLLQWQNQSHKSTTNYNLTTTWQNATNRVNISWHTNVMLLWVWISIEINDHIACCHLQFRMNCKPRCDDLQCFMNMHVFSLNFCLSRLFIACES